MVACTTPPFRAAVRLNSGVRPGMQISRKFIVVAALLSACSAGQSSRWQYVTSDVDGARFYIDPSSVRAVGDHLETWELADFRDDGSGWKSMKSRVHYRCSQGTSAWLESEFYSGGMGTGTVVSSRKERDQSFKPPALDTPSSLLTKRVCSLPKPRA